MDLLGPDDPNAAPQLKEYKKLVREGDAALDQGQLARAERLFRTAADLELDPEMPPSFEVLVRVAEIKCLEHARDAQKFRAEYRCMLDVYCGQKPCRDANGNENLALPHACAMQVCGEIYESMYEENKKDPTCEAEFYADLARVEQLCRAPKP
ncbi:MAG TPA: hypothetical protein VMR50_19190 [Myxococcota bacterium]|nr:hypothetical protein [Myxococcota bacterium]